jgi:hypothetical protein
MARKVVEPQGLHEMMNRLEKRLEGTLRPIAAPKDFVHGLRQRIHLPAPRLLARRLSNLEFVLIVVGGVMSLAVLIAALARALFHLLRRRGDGLAA